MQRLLLATLLCSVTACGDKRSETTEQPATAPSAPPSPQRPAPAVAADPASSPAAEPAAAAVPIDCAALLTSADVEELCGKALPVEVSDQEGKFKAMTCARRIVSDPERSYVNPIDLTVNVTSPSGARGLFKLNEEDHGKDPEAVRVDGGEGGLFFTRLNPMNGGRDLEVAGYRGAAYLMLRASLDKGARHACSDDAFAKLGARALGRLP